MAYTPTELDSPFARLGGEEPVRRLVTSFYDQMEATEPTLAALHSLDEQGRVSQDSRANFTLFLIEWLGGPRNFFGHAGPPAFAHAAWARGDRRKYARRMAALHGARARRTGSER